MFSIQGAWGAPSQPQLKTLVARKKKQANGLRHPSKKEAQGSKSSKPSRRKARFQKSLKNEHHAHTKRKFQKLQTVETGRPLLREICKPSKQNGNFFYATDARSGRRNDPRGTWRTTRTIRSSLSGKKTKPFAPQLEGKGAWMH